METKYKMRRSKNKVKLKEMHEAIDNYRWKFHQLRRVDMEPNTFSTRKEQAEWVETLTVRYQKAGEDLDEVLLKVINRGLANE